MTSKLHLSIAAAIAVATAGPTLADHGEDTRLPPNPEEVAASEARGNGPSDAHDLPEMRPAKARPREQTAARSYVLTVDPENPGGEFPFGG